MTVDQLREVVSAAVDSHGDVERHVRLIVARAAGDLAQVRRSIGAFVRAGFSAAGRAGRGRGRRGRSCRTGDEGRGRAVAGLVSLERADRRGRSSERLRASVAAPSIGGSPRRCRVGRPAGIPTDGAWHRRPLGLDRLRVAGA